MACVTTVKYSIKFNGSLLEAFSPTRGLRQGDPLSPFLFLFVADGLSSLLRNEVNKNRITPIKVCRRAPGISHLLFADDTLLFFQATPEQALCVSNALDVFAACTGQLINQAKCSIMFSASCPIPSQEAIRAILHVEKQGFEERYLGLPTPDGRMHRGKFDNLQSRLCKRLLEWGDSLLAQSGREIFIKAVAQAIPTYLMGVFKLPLSLCDDLTKLVRDYWWGAEKGKKRAHWVSWTKLNRSKNQGGLGFRDMRLFNQALLARQAWRLLLFPDSLCARVLKARYYPDGHLTDTVFSGNPSSTWTAISHGLELLKKGLIWRIGNGKSVRIWRDNWIPRDSHFKTLTPRGRNRLRRVSDLISADGAWKVDLIRNNFYPIDAEAVLKFSPSKRMAEDMIAWHPEKSGLFSVRSAYRLALNASKDQCEFPTSSTFPDGQHPCWPKIWKSSVPPKVKVFAWKAASGALATEENKRHHHMRVTGHCKICGSELEGVKHALYSCPHAYALWTEMRRTWSLPTDADLMHPTTEWFQSVLQHVPNHMIDTFFLVTWRAWYARNEATHDKLLPPVDASKSFLCSYIKLLRDIKDKPTMNILKGKGPVFVTGAGPKVPDVRKGPDKPWCKPPVNWVKLSVDGSFCATEGSAGAGMVLRDSNGDSIFMSCTHLVNCQGPFEAELRACKEGLERSLQMSELPIIVESDCSMLVNAVNSTTPDRSPYLHFVHEIRDLATQFSVCKFVKVDRIQVRVSDSLANFARVQNRTMFWLSSGPDDALRLLELDRNVTLPV